MTAQRVVIIETGVANVASVSAAFVRLGAHAQLTDSSAAIERASAVVLPGVGSFAAGMARLRGAGLVAPLRERIARGRATLAVCLGMQMLCESSEEAPSVSGLGVCAGALERFPQRVRTPLIGWSKVQAQEGGNLVETGAAYFAHSYRLTTPTVGWTAAWADHGGRFVAALEQGAVLACQFHPELSGAFGEALLRRWLERTGVATKQGALQ